MTFDFIQSVQAKYGPEVFEMEPDSKFSSVVGRKIVLLLRCLNPFGYSHSGIYQEVFGFPTKQKPFYDSWGHVFVDKNAMEHEKQSTLQKMEQDPQYPIKMARKCEILGEELYAYSKGLKKADFSGKTDEEIKAFAQGLFDRIAMLCSFLLFPLSLQRLLEENLIQALSQKIGDQQLKDEYLLALTTPIKPNWGYYEQLTILRLAGEYRDQAAVTDDMEKEIKNYLFEFDHQGTKYGYGEVWKYDDVLDRLDFLSKQKDLDEKINHMETLPERQKEAVQSVLVALKADQELVDMVERCRTYVYLRTYRTDALSASLANAFSLFTEIGRRNRLSLTDILESMPNEILAFNFPDQETIGSRAKASIVRAIEGNIYCAVGDEAERITKNILSQGQTQSEIFKETEKISQEIKGNVANPGLVCGVVSIVAGNTELGKVKPGNVLVAVMTTPDFVPAMEKASAFVTDEGGILCHAAIVSREMGKPCIIGTKNATKVLKDGDEVEVDADKGIVRILKRA